MLLGRIALPLTSRRALPARRLAALGARAGYNIRGLPASLHLLLAAATACARPAEPAPAGPLGYGLPSPPNAVYTVADTLTVEMHRPGGNLKMAARYAMTVDLSFRQDPAGIRVTGIAEDFEGSMSNLLQPDRFSDLGYLGKTIEFTLNRRGVRRVASYPELSGRPAELFSFGGLPYDIFPPLPGEEMEAFGSWVDTVVWHTDSEALERTFTGVYAYTLSGDTVVDGRALVRVAFTGEIETDDALGRPLRLTWHDVKGPVTGFLLWDPDRRLVAYQQYERTLEGTVTPPDRPSTGTTLAGVVRIRLVR